MKPDLTNIDEIVTRHLPSAPREQVEADGARVLSRLRSMADGALGAALDDQLLNGKPASRSGWRRVAMASAAALLLAGSIGAAIVWHQEPPFAVVERVDGALYRVDAAAVYGIPAGEPLASGETVRTNGDAGAQLALADGSRVEMRSQSELSLERADDGVSIRLSQGGIIVNAAKQRAGHLYVQTKDVRVSVAGTVFLVNVEPEGSLVAVIEGEVRVQQGATEKTLLPGEQVATSPSMESPPVVDEIAWSPNAPAHLALLRQSGVRAEQPAAEPAAPGLQQAAGAAETFEVVAIRLRAGGGGGARSGGPDGDPASTFPRVPACGGGMDLDPRLVRFRGYTLYRLITVAYGGNCFTWERMTDPELLAGGPDWMRSDQWDIEARIPEGPLPYTPRFVDIGGGRAAQQHNPGPRLQSMLQAMLADRFKLVVRRESRQVPVYVLTVAKGGARLTAWKEGDPTTERELLDFLARNGTLLSERELADRGLTAAEFSDRWMRRSIEIRSPGLLGAKASMAHLVAQLESATLRPVLDRTGLTGEFVYRVRLTEGAGRGDVGPQNVPGGASPGSERLNRLVTSLERELGLRLEPAKGPGEILVIDRVERPTEN
jgi:uncharacterized protein (TIGR03435 family)